MDNVGSSCNEDEEDKRAQINNLIQTLHTLYEVAKIPSTARLMYLQRNLSGPQFKTENTITTKSNTLALVLKDVADRTFCAGKYDEASKQYTQCLAHAEAGSAEAGHAYANRSAASFKLFKYEQCLLDIDRALSSNYPEDKKQKLRERKERCLSLMANKPRRAFGVAAAAAAVAAAKSPLADQTEDEWCKLCDFKNPLLPSTSNKVKLECNETWGRHMIATEDIEAGEILFCEEYYSLMVGRPYKWENCSYCTSACEVLIPCPNCNQAMYCSESCRTGAFNLYHRIECKIFQHKKLYDDLKEEEDLMALKMLLSGTGQGAGLRTLMEKLTKWDLFVEKVDPTDKPFAGDYLSVLTLCRTFDKPLLNFTSHPVLIVKIIIALQNAGYFDTDPDQPNVVLQKRLNETELFAALLLFNHMISVKASTSGLTQFFDHEFRERSVGFGVSILYNMINHSCNPNVDTVLRDREKVLFAVRPISKGEQIFTSYTETFMYWPIETRAACLSNPLKGCLSFTCQCEACVNKWPTIHGLLLRKPKYSIANVKMAKNKFKKMMLPLTCNRISTLSSGEILQLVCRIRKWLHTNIESPCSVILFCDLLLRYVMKYLYDSTTPDIMKETGVIEDVETMLSDISKYFDETYNKSDDPTEVLI